MTNEQASSKPKIAVVGIGTAGYELVHNLAQKDDLENIDLHYLESSRVPKSNDSNPNINMIHLTANTRKVELETISALFKLHHNCDEFKKFQANIIEGDELYVADGPRCETGLDGCQGYYGWKTRIEFYFGDGSHNHPATSKIVWIKRNGKKIHQTLLAKRYVATEKSENEVTQEGIFVKFLRKTTGLLMSQK